MLAVGSGYRCKLSAGICADKTDYDDRRYGGRECKALHADDDLYHDCKAALLGHGVCPGIRHAGCRGCKILHDHVLLYDVAVPCESLYLPVPRMGIRPDCGLDRYGGRLEPAVHSLYHPVQIRKMAESSFNEKSNPPAMLGRIE